jgi:5-methylcytosine-specific restriction endonuclease McrA
MNCKACGVDVPLRAPGQAGRQAEFCSLDCRKAFRYAPKVVKACAGCGSEFTVYAVNKLKRFCTKSCYELNRNPRNEPMHKECATCGVAFVTQIKKQRFCSVLCRYDSLAQAQAVRWREQNPRPSVFVYDCDWCESKIERPTPLGGQRRYHQECAKQAQAARYRAKNTVRQSKTAKPSRVVIEHLVAAYGAVCYLCSEPVDLDIPRTSRMGATVDHILPLAKGGSDEFENLQLAHWICNNRKSDKLIEGLNA